MSLWQLSPQGIQEPLVVKTSMEDPRWTWVSKSMELILSPFTSLTLLVGDRKSSWPVKSWFVDDWSLVYFVAPVVIATIILSSSKVPNWDILVLLTRFVLGKGHWTSHLHYMVQPLGSCHPSHPSVCPSLLFRPTSPKRSVMGTWSMVEVFLLWMFNWERHSCK